MMRTTMVKLLDYYKPLLIALFEYYLYDSFDTDNKKLEECCLPY
jgi:hypothetical protein